MIKLNLPEFAYKVTKIEGKPYIFDPIRRKNVFLTPEEWVRQHVLNWLMVALQYPKSLIRSESGLNQPNSLKRTDIVVYNRNAAPFLLVECKAPNILLSDQTLEQANRYNKFLKAQFLLITNGLEHLAFEVIDQKMKPIAHLPPLE
jgi:Type I restriction enzyme R protein N terminus (HSDR_N)